MNFNELSEQAFATVKTPEYNLREELVKPMLSTARHRLQQLNGLSSQIIDFYERLINEHNKGNSWLTPVYHLYLKKSLEGADSEFKGIRDNFKMYFHIREFKEDNVKKLAVANYFIALFNLIEGEVIKLEAERLETIRGIDAEYAKYYDPAYIFDTFREIPNEVVQGSR